jgi:2-polyprenyl-3-methyl-5-hydroxy-6-metoxy-1,4-benzoquinol methylase
VKNKISTHDKFNRDIIKYGGYKYSQKKLSTIIALSIETKFILKNLIDFQDLNFIDFGCGDGKNTKKLLKARPNSILAIDPAKNAIEHAQVNYSSNRITYKVGNLSSLNTILNNPRNKKIYDILILRGAIHHFSDNDFKFFFKIISNKNLKINILLCEPNGSNLILKVIEKISKYHIEHNERSYTHYKIKKKLEQSGYEIIQTDFFKLTPYFCPDWFAILSNYFHNFFLKIPFIKILVLGNYTILAKKS